MASVPRAAANPVIGNGSPPSQPPPSRPTLVRAEVKASEVKPASAPAQATPVVLDAPPLPADLNKSPKKESFFVQLWEIIVATFAAIGNWFRDGWNHLFERSYGIDGPSQAEMAKLPDDRLARIADGLIANYLVPRPHGPSEQDRERAARALMRVLQGHGGRPGQIERIAQHVDHYWEAGKYMRGPAQKEFLALMQSMRPKVGDWAATKQRLADLSGYAWHDGVRVEPLVTGPVAFPVMLDAIDHARPEDGINLTTFEFDSDKTSQDFARHLVAAARRGVPVRVLWDSMGTRQNAHDVDEKIFDYMAENGVQLIRHKPGPVGSHLNHRKALIIGDVAFTGGMNVGDDYGVLWRDVMARVTGPVIGDLQSTFVDKWIENGGKFTPDLQRMYTREHAKSTDKDAGSALITPHEGGKDINIKLAYLAAIDTAAKSIHVSAPYFLDPDVIAHLEARARAGVEVVMVLPQHNDMWMIKPAEQGLYKEILASGIKLYEYYGHEMAHEKVAVFDGKISTIGSSNLDPRSFQVDDELNLWSDSPATAKVLDDTVFGADLKKSVRILKAPKTGVFSWIEDHLLIPIL